MYVLILITAFFPQLLKCLDYESPDCEDVYAFPKLIGRNNSGYYTDINSLQHNEVTDRTVISGNSFDSFIC